MIQVKECWCMEMMIIIDMVVEGFVVVEVYLFVLSIDVVKVGVNIEVSGLNIEFVFF